MNKRLLLKVFLLCVFFCQLVNTASAQYATGGNIMANEGTDKLVKSIYWLTWNAVPGNPKLIQYPVNASPTNIVDGDYVWQFSPTVQIWATIQGLLVNGPNAHVIDAYTPGTYKGDGLDVLYNGNGVTAKATTDAQEEASPSSFSKGVPNSALVTRDGGGVLFNINLLLKIKDAAGVYQTTPYPGMVLADAESLDGYGEYFAGTTTNPGVKWQLLNLRRDLAKDIADAQDHYAMDITGNYFKVYINQLGTTYSDQGIQAVMYAEGATRIEDVTMKGSGKTALSLGFVIPFDLGDAPSTYGKPLSYINNFVHQRAIPNDQINTSLKAYSLVPGNYATLTAEANVYLGDASGAVDADGEGGNTTLANTTNAQGDDISNTADENLLGAGVFTGGNAIKVNRSTDITIPLPSVTNLSGSVAKVYGWIDFNRDGKFSVKERAEVVIPNGTTNSAIYSLEFPRTGTSGWRDDIRAGDTYARFRITTTALSDDLATTDVDEFATVTSGDGEIEDYFLTIAGITIAGKVVNDGNGYIGGLDLTTGLQTVGNPAQQLYAYLVDGTTVVKKVLVQSNGTYQFTGVNNGTGYKVVISANSTVVETTGTLAQVLTNQLPTGYQASGDDYGTNNLTSGAGSDGVADLQVAVSTPLILDISDINFGINKAPVANDVTVSTNSNVPVVITLPGSPHTTDADGTVVTNSVTIEDITNGNTYGTTTVNTADGKYELEVSTGKVTFTPANTFTGLVTQVIHYKIVDNFGTISNAGALNITVNLNGKDDNYSTPINTPYPDYAVKGNDGAAAGPSQVQLPSPTTSQGGAVGLNGSLVTYNPPAGFTGTDTYKYRLFDGVNTSADNNVTVTITPAGVTDEVVTPINTNAITDVRFNDPNAGTGAKVTDVLLTTPGNGGTIVNVDATAGTVEYKPFTGFTGTDTYTYKLTSADGTLKSPAIQVNVKITPAGVMDEVVTLINTNAITDVRFNDPNAGTGAKVTDVVLTTPGNGGTIVNVDATAGTVEYKPLTGFTGTDTYTYKLTSADGTLKSPAIQVNVKITPVATADNFTIPFNTATPINILTNDTGAGTDATVTNPLTTSPTHGTLSAINFSTGAMTYTPTPGFIGTDSFTYTVTSKDGTLSSTAVTVTLTVAPPVISGTPDSDVTTYKAPVETDVTQNDTDGDGTVTLLGNGVNGIVELNGKKFTYTPNDKFIGTDTYYYRLAKNGGSVDIPVTIKVYPKGTDDSDLTPVNAPLTTTVVANDGYDDGNPVTINIQTPPTSGTINLVTGTSIKYTPSQPGITTYKYTITQNGLTSAPITVSVNAYTASMTLTKTANNGYSTVGEKIYYTLILKNTGTVPLTNVEITDAKADPLSISQPLIPTLAVGDTKTITAYHTTVAADITAGKFENQAVAKGKDPKGNDVIKTSDDPTTTSTPDDPTVVPITPITNASINLAKTGAFAGNQINYTFIITNNGGAVLNTITLTDTKLGLNGVSITAPTGGLLPNQSLTYNATHTLTQADKDLGAVSNTATVNAKDPGNNTVTGTGSTVTTVTKSPVATNDVAEAESGRPEIISVLTNDDAKGSTFNLTSIEILSNPMHGTVVTNANGTVTYTPTAVYTGSDSFTYRVKDAFGYYTNTATVTITTNLVVELKIPTLFSPNGDGVNDGFVIKDLGDYAQNELIVINRWGNEVYRQANYQNSWSGTGLNEGTYFYIVRLKKSNGESWVIRKGYVTLIRTFKK